MRLEQSHPNPRVRRADTRAHELRTAYLHGLLLHLMRSISRRRWDHPPYSAVAYDANPIEVAPVAGIVLAGADTAPARHGAPRERFDAARAGRMQEAIVHAGTR